MSKGIWVISELYYPEETSTGYLLTQIAESLGETWNVDVLCSQPTYSARGLRCQARERLNGVTIHRCWSTFFDRRMIPLRLINLITISISIFIAAVFKLSKEDYILVVTNPPLLPFVVAIASKIRRARCLLIIHDVYPEVLVATGMILEDTFAVRFMRKINTWLYRSCDKIIVLGRDMAGLVAKKLETGDNRVVVIHNWADTELVRPDSRSQNRLLNDLGLGQRFVVQYAGNIGHTHGLEVILETAERLHDDVELGDVHFLFIGSGSRKEWLENAVGSKCLRNVTILPNRPRSDQQNFLNACDVAMISFRSGMVGVSVPSRMYNIMATGKPIIAIAEEDSELAMVVREECIGWVVPPNRPDLLVDVIRQARSSADVLARMGKQARTSAEEKYTLRHVKDAYRGVMEKLLKSEGLRA